MSLTRRIGISLSDAGESRRSMSTDGVLFRKAGLSVTTASVNEEVAATISLPRNLISADQRGLFLRAEFNLADNTNNKLARWRLTDINGTTVASSGVITVQNKLMILETRVIRTAPTTADAYCAMIAGTTTSTLYTAVTGVTLAQLAAVVITMQTSSQAGDITLKGYYVGFLSPGGMQTLGGALA